MELAAILIVPALASALSLLPLGRRFAAPITLAASVIVFAFTVIVAGQAAHGAEPQAFGGWLTTDGLGALVLVLVGFVGAAAALYSLGYIRMRAADEPTKERHYYVLYNLFLLSLVAVPILANVALMWVAVELTTLLSAFLVGFDDTPEALEAAWKYVMLTTLGAVLALLGFLLLYWGSRIAGLEPFTWAGLVKAAPNMPPAILWPAFLFILVGFGTKVGLVPMHTWLPDAHSQAPASICALLSGVETTVVLYVILRLFPVIGGSPALDARPWFIGFGLLSVAVATLLLIYVRDFKRLFAFSTVEHMGIILFAAGLGGTAAHLGAAYQMVGHTLGKSFCFFAAGMIAVSFQTQEIAAIRGLARRLPFAALALAGGAFAIVGAPPFAIFVSELTILKAGIDGGYYIPIAVLAIFIVIAFCAIIYHINRMVFGASEGDVLLKPTPFSSKLTLVLAAIPLVIIGIYTPTVLQALVRAAAAAMGG
jgi:hydrogenase-4 component F